MKDWQPHTPDPIRVFLVEDDARLGALTQRYLEGSGMRVTWVRDGDEALRHAERGAFDVILLDLMLPERDGVDVCRRLRAFDDVPIIMVTARKEEADRVLGLDAGADDYVTKPFSSRELVSRIRAHVRRARGLLRPGRALVQVGGLSLDPGSMAVSVDGQDIPLTGYEFNLLRVLAERPGRVLTREQLLDMARGGAEEAFDRSIDVTISRLRQKLGDDARQPRWIKTVRGVGYLLADHGEA